MVLITNEDLINSGCFDIKSVVELVERFLFNYKSDNVILPNKVSMIFDERNQNRINCLPAGFYDKNIYGVKWVSVFPNNPKTYGVPNVSALVLVSELTSGRPVAIMDGTLVSNMRTAAVSAVAARYLSKSNTKSIGFIGAGEQAKMHFLTIKNVFPNIDKCWISSRTAKSELAFKAQLQSLYTDVDFVTCDGDYQKAVVDADIVVTAISGQEEILKSNWIGEGTFYCHVAGVEDEYAVALKADKIVVDLWEAVKHRTQTISRMYSDGLLSDNDIYADLDEIVKLKKVGRESDKEFIYFNAVGLSYIDIAVANFMIERVIESGFGTEFPLVSGSLLDVDITKIKL